MAQVRPGQKPKKGLDGDPLFNFERDKTHIALDLICHIVGNDTGTDP